MKRVIGIGFLFAVGFVGWKAGEAMNPQSVGVALGVIFGMMAGIPAALIAFAARRVQGQRLDIYHHDAQPSKPVAALAVKPQSYIVIEDLPALATVGQGRIEVKRGNL